jgi:RNA polymerase sigma-70 factor, ECF subfamily
LRLLILQLFTKKSRPIDWVAAFGTLVEQQPTAIVMSDFNDLLEAQIPRLRRYARALLRDMTRADDLVQDTIVRALAKQHLWQPGSNLRAWLFTLMHNQHVNNLRHIRREETAVDFDEISSTLIATTDPTASCQLRELDRGLARLPVEQREVILLVGLEGVRYDEAAAILDVPIGTVRSRLFRGREALRRLMDMDEVAGASASLQQEPEGRAAA